MDYTENIYEVPFDCEYSPEESNNKEKRSNNIINIEKLVNGIPDAILKETKIVINIYSNESFSLNPCEKKSVCTGVILKTFLPVYFCAYFEGVTNNLCIKSESKCVIPLFERELKIEVINYKFEKVHIPQQMPLGKLIIKAVV